MILEPLASSPYEDASVNSVTTIEGSRVRGILLHKLMEELISGELVGSLDAATNRSRALIKQLASISPERAVDGSELAGTALKTLQLPDVQRYRECLVAEVPIYATVSTDDNLVSGRADAIAYDDDGSVVFDWKSDVAPNDTDRKTYRRQLGHYLDAIGSRRGAIVYMTSGRIDWVTPFLL